MILLYVPNSDCRYLCREDGCVFRSDGKRMNQWIDRDGYANVDFRINFKRSRWKVHRPVAYLFIHGYDQSLDVNHIDFNRLNNHYLNLNYKTKAQNAEYSGVNGRLSENAAHFKSRSYRQKNVVIQMDMNGAIINEYESLTLAARSVGKSKNGIWRVISGISKSAYGYKWSYK